MTTMLNYFRTLGFVILVMIGFAAIVAAGVAASQERWGLFGADIFALALLVSALIEWLT